MTACSRDRQALKASYLANAPRYVLEGKLAEEYRNALPADPSDPENRLKLAEAYKSGDVRRVGLEYVRAADVLHRGVDVQIRFGNILLFGQRFQDVKVRAEEALAVAPPSDLDAAVSEIEATIRLQPERGATYSNLGARSKSAGGVWTPQKGRSRKPSSLTNGPRRHALHSPIPRKGP